MTIITIDPEFRDLIVPPSPAELELLTASIKAQGCLEPLYVWKTDDNRILLDGHTRHAICTELKQDYTTRNVTLGTREEAKLWILEHQAGRRNLTDDQRAVIWNDIREQRSKVISAKQLAAARDTKTKVNPVARLRAANRAMTPLNKKMEDLLSDNQPIPTEFAARHAAADKEFTAALEAVQAAQKAGSVKITEPVKVDTRAAVAIEAKLPENKLRQAQALKKHQPELYKKVLAGEIKLRDTSKLVKPTLKKERFAEADFYSRVGRTIHNLFKYNELGTRLDEIAGIKKSQWCPQAEEGIKRLLKNLEEVKQQTEKHTKALKAVLKANKKFAGVA